MPTDYKKLVEACPHVQSFKEHVREEERLRALGDEFHAAQYHALHEIDFDRTAEIALVAQPELRAERDAARAAGDKTGEEKAFNEAVNRAEASCVGS
ncbi:MAG: hypothetical protein QOJ84_3776 [Bradyrhizobium sp.]|jgi:hypothetical protein|nr:hypothetical protein [Bradyrhizobium sp.]